MSMIETTPPATPETPPATSDKPVETPPTPPAAQPTAAELQAEVDKWKGLSRKHEERAAANATAATELAAFKASQMTEQEQAVAAAKAAGSAEATSTFGQKLARAELKAALTGIVPDPAEVVDDLDLSKYVTDTGDVDEDAVKKLAAKYAGFAGKPAPADLKQGNRGVVQTPGEPSLDEQIEAAKKAGNVSLAMRLTNRKLTAPAAD